MPPPPQHAALFCIFYKCLILYTYMYIICKYTKKSTENNLWHLPWRPHVCTLYQVVYALTSFREWSVPDSRSPHHIRQGCAACIGG